MQDKEQVTLEGLKCSKCYLMAAVFFVFGLLLVTLGFWKTLVVSLLTAAGAFLGSRKDLRSDISTQVNRVFPPKGQKVTYSAEEIEKIKKTLEQKNKAEE
jgi:uncharacterized membrane protein